LAIKSLFSSSNSKFKRFLKLFYKLFLNVSRSSLELFNWEIGVGWKFVVPGCYGCKFEIKLLFVEFCTEFYLVRIPDCCVLGCRMFEIGAYVDKFVNVCGGGCWFNGNPQTFRICSP